MGKKAAAPGKAPAGEGEAQRKRKQGAPVRRDNGEKPTKRAKKKKTAVEIKAEAAEKEVRFNLHGRGRMMHASVQRVVT
jgi:hypothetical protein